MFETFQLQNLNKLVKGEVRDLSSPQAFHSVKVKRLCSNQVKPPTKISSEFPMEIFALVGNFGIESCEFSDGSIGVVRAFDFTRKAFIAFSKLFQGLLQRLRMLYLLTGVECEKSVFHTEVCAYAFTCSGQHFFRGIIGHDIKPICSNSVVKDLDIADVAFPISMLMKREPTFIKLQRLRGILPRFEGKTDTPIFKFIGGLELRRTKLMACFRFRCADASAVLAVLKPIKETLPSDMQTDNHGIKGVAWNPCPMLLCPLEQLRQMRLQPIPSGVFAIEAVIAFLKFEKVVMYIRKVIKHVAQAFVLGMMAYLVFIGSQEFHGSRL